MAFDRTSPAILVSVRSPGKSAAVPLDLEGRVLSFSFDDDEKKADKGTLVLDNFDLVLFDLREIIPGTLLDITWGYNGLFSQTQSLVVKSIKGSMRLTVTAESKKTLSNLEIKSSVYENVAYSDIARQLAAANGFREDQIHVDDTLPVFEMVTQARMTDSQFLRHLANKISFEWYVDTGGFHFHDRKIGQAPTRKFIWYNDPDQGDILSFSIEEKSKKAGGGNVTVKGRDPSKKTDFSSDANNKSDKSGESTSSFVLVTSGKGNSGGFVKVNKPSTPKNNTATSTDQPSPAPNGAAGAAIARGSYRKAALESAKLTLNCVGDPEITAKSTIEVVGIGKSFSGVWYVEKIKHSISGSGYTMTITCKRQGRNASLGAGSAGAEVAGGKVNKQQSPGGGIGGSLGTRVPVTVLVPNDDGTGLKAITVYKKDAK